jgi:endonuclease-3
LQFSRLAGIGAARTSRAVPKSAADEKARVASIRKLLRRMYPAPRCALSHDDAFQLLVATILSAQCTDERVNLVTPELFRRWPTPAALARADQAELEGVIRSTGFFRNKARSLLGAARVLCERFGGEVPKTMEELLELPGVARKTANVVLGTAYGIAAGIVVDTHVTRVSQRLRLANSTQPEKIERELMQQFAERDWIWLAHALIWHGRRLCKARNPDCPACALAPYCPAARVLKAGTRTRP